MRIQAKSIIAGPQGVIQPGQLADLPDEQAYELVAGGYATCAEPPGRVAETAVTVTEELAVIRRKPRKA